MRLRTAACTLVIEGVGVTNEIKGARAAGKAGKRALPPTALSVKPSRPPVPPQSPRPPPPRHVLHLIHPPNAAWPPSNSGREEGLLASHSFTPSLSLLVWECFS